MIFLFYELNIFIWVSVYFDKVSKYFFKVESQKY